jgi:glycine betaine/proline transport system ATP-binding protein
VVGETSDISELKVPEDAIIETVVEAVLNEPKPVAVIDEHGQMVGVLNRKSIIHILFGKNNTEASTAKKTTGLSS